MCTPTGLPVTFVLANPKIDEREVARDLFEMDPGLLGNRPGQRILADKGYTSKEFERFLFEHGAHLVRPTMRRERIARRARCSSPCVS